MRRISISCRQNDILHSYNHRFIPLNIYIYIEIKNAYHTYENV